MDTTDMWWKTRDGKRMKASEMSPTHMFYSLRLLYNKCVPAEFQLVAGNTQVTTQNRDHRSAMGILFGLLAQGDRMEQLSDEMLEQLVYMQKVVREKL